MTDRLGRHDGYASAAFAWVPSRGVSNIIQIKDSPVEWAGDFLVSSLKGARLFRMRLDGDRVVYSEPIAIGERIRYVHQHRGGAIVLWTDSRKIILLHPAQTVSVESRVEKALSSYDAEQKMVIEAAFNRCIECHAISGGQHQTSPSLAGVYGRRIADTSYENYSPCLTGKRWDLARREPEELYQGSEWFCIRDQHGRPRREG
ncbi:MAG: PQQ-dependent sugar dehydrogenase [Proteobacteria bacterium]|nr:PQQ-dependent sugar dehydrogenase [Pseudomonadota bacterium]